MIFFLIVLINYIQFYYNFNKKESLFQKLIDF